mmetsp:Transcript_26957/g.55465  ORF Transcript_26957/g.55465 Transcript_26957/m.55465 type:complete len:511 (+) Transcript_26957:98-1630(+)
MAFTPSITRSRSLSLTRRPYVWTNLSGCQRRLAARKAFFLASLGALSSTPITSNFSALPFRVPAARPPPRSTGIHGISSNAISGPGSPPCALPACFALLAASSNSDQRIRCSVTNIWSCSAFFRSRSCMTRADCSARSRRRRSVSSFALRSDSSRSAAVDDHGPYERIKNVFIGTDVELDGLRDAYWSPGASLGSEPGTGAGRPGTLPRTSAGPAPLVAFHSLNRSCHFRFSRSSSVSPGRRGEDGSPTGRPVRALEPTGEPSVSGPALVPGRAPLVSGCGCGSVAPRPPAPAPALDPVFAPDPSSSSSLSSSSTPILRRFMRAPAPTDAPAVKSMPAAAAMSQVDRWSASTATDLKQRLHTGQRCTARAREAVVEPLWTVRGRLCCWAPPRPPMSGNTPKSSSMLATLPSPCSLSKSAAPPFPRACKRLRLELVFGLPLPLPLALRPVVLPAPNDAASLASRSSSPKCCLRILARRSSSSRSRRLRCCDAFSSSYCTFSACTAAAVARF